MPRPPEHLELERLAGPIVAYERHHVVHRVHLVAVDRLDDVADVHAGLLRRAHRRSPSVTVGPSERSTPLIPRAPCVAKPTVRSELAIDNAVEIGTAYVIAIVADRREDDAGDVTRAIHQRAARRGRARRGGGLEQAARCRSAREGHEAVGGGDEPAAHPRRSVSGSRCADHPCRVAGFRRARRERSGIARECRASVFGASGAYRASSSARSVVASRPMIRAWCTTPSAVVTSILTAFPTSRSLVRISPVRRTHTPEPRRVRLRSCALTATTECPLATATALAVTIGALVGTTLRIGAVVGRAAERADRAQHGQRQDRSRGAGHQGGGPDRLRARRRLRDERRELARVQPQAIERVGERACGAARASSSSRKIVALRRRARRPETHHPR